MNITIDDASSDPLTGSRITYGVTNGIAGKWNVGQNCPQARCLAQLDPSQAFNGTWHDSTNATSARDHLPFASGVAVHVMGIFVSGAPESRFSPNNSGLFFWINGTDEGSFIMTAFVESEIVHVCNSTPFFVNENPIGKT